MIKFDARIRPGSRVFFELGVMMQWQVPGEYVGMNCRPPGWPATEG
jgi:hypothetical protein